MLDFTKKFIFSFILLVFLPIMSLIFFQQMKTREIFESIQPPPQNVSVNFETSFVAPNHSGMLPQAPIIPPTPPIAIPQIVIMSACFLLCLFWVNYLKKNFIFPLNDIIKGVKAVKTGNYNYSFTTDCKNPIIIKTFEVLNAMVKGLEEREKLKKCFIQNLVHDLRSPIMAQERAISILKDEFKGHELLDGMDVNNKVYLKIINLILECCNCDKTDVKIEKISFNLLQLVKNIQTNLTPLFSEKNITFISDIKPENLDVYCDYVSLSRILINLISNATENIECNKTITLRAHKTDVINIIVEDNGKGIELEQIATIFDRYCSGNKSANKTVSGLGLSITKELVEKNGGEIEVESKVGEYTKFIIKLPLGVA